MGYASMRRRGLWRKLENRSAIVGQKLPAGCITEKFHFFRALVAGKYSKANLRGRREKEEVPKWPRRGRRDSYFRGSSLRCANVELLTQLLQNGFQRRVVFDPGLQCAGRSSALGNHQGPCRAFGKRTEPVH